MGMKTVVRAGGEAKLLKRYGDNSAVYQVGKFEVSVTELTGYVLVKEEGEILAAAALPVPPSLRESDHWFTRIARIAHGYVVAFERANFNFRVIVKRLDDVVGRNTVLDIEFLLSHKDSDY